MWSFCNNPTFKKTAVKLQRISYTLQMLRQRNFLGIMPYKFFDIKSFRSVWSTFQDSTELGFTRSEITNFFLSKRNWPDWTVQIIFLEWTPTDTNNHLCMCDKYVASLQILCPLLCSVIFTGSIYPTLA